MIRKLVKFSTISIIIVSLYGCAIVRYKHEAKINRVSMLNLKIGMSKTQVFSLMGNPYKSESYQVEGKNLEFWLYRTEIYVEENKSDNFTPLAFENDILIGWGRNYYDNAFRIKQDIKIEER